MVKLNLETISQYIDTNNQEDYQINDYEVVGNMVQFTVASECFRWDIYPEHVRAISSDLKKLLARYLKMMYIKTTLKTKCIKDRECQVVYVQITFTNIDKIVNDTKLKDTLLRIVEKYDGTLTDLITGEYFLTRDEIYERATEMGQNVWTQRWWQGTN